MLVQPRDAEAKRIERELHAVADAELREDVVQMRLDRVLADEEPRADLGIAKAEGDPGFNINRTASRGLAAGAGLTEAVIFGYRIAMQKCLWK